MARTDTGLDLGCLLIHGFGGSAFEMEPLASAFQADGAKVRITVLPGHGPGYPEFTRFRFDDWLRTVEAEYATLAGTCRAVLVTGFSLGGLLALNLAARNPVAGIITLSAPIRTPDRLFPARQLRMVRRAARRLLPGSPSVPLSEPVVSPSRRIAPWQGYAGAPSLGQLLSIRRGCRETRALLPHLTAPLLAIQDRGDRSVAASNMRIILAEAGSPRKTGILTASRETVSGRHMITTHRETAAFVAGQARMFARSIAGND